MLYKKYLLSLFLVLTGASAFAQFNRLLGTWVTASNELLLIGDSLNRHENANMLCSADEDEGFNCYLSGDTLKFHKHVSAAALHDDYMYADKYEMIILSLTDTLLTVKPFSPQAKQLYGKEELTFIKQEFNIDSSIVFERLIYHTGTCMAHCPSIDIEIDNNRNIYLVAHFYKKSHTQESGIYGEKKYETDLAKSGLFVGKLNMALYRELIQLIQTCNLKTLEFAERPGDDAPETTLIVYYNGERKYLKSRYPPVISKRLLNYLLHINERAALKKTFEKRTLEY